jgi:hypothetical protein
MMDLGLSREEFAVNLRRYFWAEDVTAAEVERLHSAFRDLLSEPERVRGQDAALLRLENTEPVFFGLRWWEERQQGRDSIERPFSMIDRANMFLCTDKLAGKRPKARLYCPAWAVGTWRSESGETAREWQLRADETLIARDDEARDGAGWCVHLAPTPQLWILLPSSVRPEHWDVVARADDALELRLAGDGETLRLTHQP